MIGPLEERASALTPKLGAPQQKPRPLTLFLELVRSETGDNPERLSRVLRGLRAYQEAPRHAAQHQPPQVAAIAGASLRSYGGSGPPLLLVPSLINPPNVLDLAPENSLAGWLAGRGHSVFLLDWGWDVAARQTLSVAGHVEEILLPLLSEIGEAPALVGHCLGGTMAVAAAAAAKASAVTTIAAPWRFSGFAEKARQSLAGLWSAAKPDMEAMGLLPMEVLQCAFWALDPQRTVSKFERFAELPPGSSQAEAFVRLEDWANDGPPIGEAAARELFEGFFAEDLPGRRAWKVAGTIADPAALSCPLLNIVSTTDRIVPNATAISAGDRLDLPQGHVGMIVGSSAPETLWEPLRHWLSRIGAS